MKRIIVTCLEQDLEEITAIFENNCPFNANFPENCGEYARCGECIEENIEFEIMD